MAEINVNLDNLSVYFKQLAEHNLLTAEDEKEISQGIEDTEILTWERVLSRPDALEAVREKVKELIDVPASFSKLMKSKQVNKAKGYRIQTARALRENDLDRVVVDAVIKELEAKTDWYRQTETNAVHWDKYLRGIKQAYRDASNLRNEFIRANLRLVVTMARRYDRGGMPLSDLIQEGNLGLMHAVSRFDYKRGLRFSTYACWWIRHAIGRALADKARAVRIPVHMLEAQQHIDKVHKILVGELGRVPTPKELAKAAGIPLSKLDQNYKYIMGQSISIDSPIHDDDDRNLSDTITDPLTEENVPVDRLTIDMLVKQMKRLLNHLTPIEADVLTKRFGLVDDEELTFKEIGDQYNLSRERIRQIQNTALDKLKRALEREHKGQVEL